MSPAEAQPPKPISPEAIALEVADVLNTTLELDAVLARVAEVVHRAIDYEIFAILLLNEKTQEMRMRFQIGHDPALAERVRVKVGKGVTGRAAELRRSIRVDDVTQDPNYINAHPDVRSELAVPLIVKNRVIGVVDIQSVKPAYFTADHERLLTLLASRIAVAIENARLYTRIYRQAQTLSILNEISREVTSILTLDRLLKRVGELLSRVIDYQMFSILLLDRTGTTLQHRFSLRYKQDIQLKHDIPLGRGLVGYAAQHKVPVLVPDVKADPRYIALNEETRSELVVPLIYQDRVIGVLDLEHTRRGYFNDDHVRTLTTLSAQVAVAIENARLYERIHKEEQRLERELGMARELQTRLLPPCCPTLQSAQLAAKFIPARAIGGDLYDFLEYTGPRTAIVIGDVSGKGAPAALYAALVSGILRSMAATEPGAAEMMQYVNASLNERAVAAQFVSLIFAIWDDVDRTMQIANSGLPRPIYCHEGACEIIDAAGLPCGLFEDATYDELNISASTGDVFVFFTDGILDARDETGELFPRYRLEEIVCQNCHKTADEIVEAIFSAVLQHSTGQDPFDDQTVVAVKILPGGEIEQAQRRINPAEV